MVLSQLAPDDIILVRTRDQTGGRATLYREVRAGRMTRISRGAYVSSAAWEGLSLEQRHRAAMLAVAMQRPDVVFSHRSAAVAWGLPLIGAPPTVPEFLVPLDLLDRSDSSASVHRTVRPFETTTATGLPTTDLPRTLLDVARRQPATVSVPMLDHALREEFVTRERLCEEWRSGTHIGSRRGRYALDLADDVVMSPGESLSKVLFDSFGLPRPEVQKAFFDRAGLIGYVDFWWPQFNVIGEFDGLGKYLRDEFLSGRTSGDVVVLEKRREDRLRATLTHPSVARWGWDALTDPTLLRRELHRAGIPIARF